MNKKERIMGNFIALGILGVYLAFVGAIIWGWISNIIWLIQLDNLVWNGEQILSVVGVVVAPLGALMGFLH